MLINPQKEHPRFFWTMHAKRKMVFYHLSSQRVLLAIRHFDRRENGIAQSTIAYMKRNDHGKRKEEIWVMVALRKGLPGFLDIISAWRYPGVTNPNSKVVLPSHVLEDLTSFLENTA